MLSSLRGGMSSSSIGSRSARPDDYSVKNAGTNIVSLEFIARRNMPRYFSLLNGLQTAICTSLELSREEGPPSDETRSHLILYLVLYPH